MHRIHLTAIGIVGLTACGVRTELPYPQPKTAAYTRDMDTFLMCENGGMVEAVFEQPIVDGRYDQDWNGGIGTIGTTGAFKFRMYAREDGALTGDNGVWFPASLPDDADQQCAALEQQPWWSSPPRALPAPAAFTSPTIGFATIADCDAATAAGMYMQRCDLELLMCPDGTAYGVGGDFNDAVDQAPYDLVDGTASTQGELQEGAFAVTLYADGTLSPLTVYTNAYTGTPPPPWTTVDPSVVSADLSCSP